MTDLAAGTARAPRRPPRPGRTSDLLLRTAVVTGRSASWLSRASGLGRGGAVGGRVLLRLAPDAASLLAAGRQVVLVSGTNGKTTTTALLAEALRSCVPVDTNDDGASTPAGLARALTGEAGTVVLETDEAWVPWAVDQTRPALAVLLNLTRDQLDRHHEVGRLTARWRQAAAQVPLVVANADDPDVVWAALAAREQVWVACGRRWAHDDTICPRCGGTCVHDAAGGWACACGLRRPEPHWWLEGDDLVCAERRLPLRLSLPGEVNLSNAALAVAAAVALEVPPRVAASRLRRVEAAAGRYEVVRTAHHEARLLLATNPAGWLETVRLVAGSATPAVLAFGSEGVDGRDPSWLYDVDFTPLRGRRVVVTGRRSTDLEVRLALDGVDGVEHAEDVRHALDLVPPGPVDVVGNHSGFQDARRVLRRARADH